MLTVLFLAGGLLFAANCSSDDDELDFASLLVASNFTDNQDGTVSDNNTGLTWMKCSYGQGYNGIDCAQLGGGTVFNAKSVSYCEQTTTSSQIECTNGDLINPIAVANDGALNSPAFDACDNTTSATGNQFDAEFSTSTVSRDGWRLPTKEEFAALLEAVSNRETLLSIFPNTPDDKYYWTASGKENSDGDAAYGFGVADANFNTREEFNKADSFLYIRCVK